MAYSKNVAEYVVSRSEELGGTWADKHRKVVEEVKEKFGVVMNVADGDSFRKSVKSLADKIGRDIKSGKSRLDEKISEINAATDDKKKYEVKDGNYHIPTKRGTFVIPCEDADRIFLDYSEKGNDMSQEQVIQKYKLKPEAWNAIKGAFRLYKKSHVVSPYTLETATEEKLSHIIEDANAAHLDRFREKFDKDYERQMKANVEKWKKFYFTEQIRNERLQEAIANWKPLPTFVPAPTFEKSKGMKDKLFVFISDMHLGNKGTGATRAAMKLVVQKAISAPEKEIYLVDTGDNGEAFVQMHGGQLENGTDQDYGYGMDLACNIADILEEMVIEILEAGKQVYFFGVTGNHDRFSAKQEGDPRFSAGIAIYELLKRGLRNTSAKIAYAKERVEALEYETFVMVMHHGLVKGPVEKFAMPYMHRGKHVFVVSGHEHSMNVSHGFNCTHVKMPGLAGPGEYDRSMMMFGQRGAMFARANDFGSVDFEINFYETDNTMPLADWDKI